MPDLKIDPEFSAMNRPLTDDEYTRLQNAIETEGCLSPLVVWRQENILVDGHNRYAICTETGTAFETTELDFATRDEALLWVIKHQLARRNLTDAERKYLLGKAYNARKKSSGDNLKKGDESPIRQNGGSGTTAEDVAAENGVSARTVERAGAFAAELDGLGEPERRSALSGGRKDRKPQEVNAAWNALARQVRAIPGKVAALEKLFGVDVDARETLREHLADVMHELKLE